MEQIVHRLTLAKSDFNKFADNLERIFNAGGENRRVIDKALSYPITLSSSDVGAAPVMVETYASKDRLGEKTKPEIKERKLTIQDANGNESVTLKFPYTDEYYDDPITGERESIEVPYVNFENLDKFIEFTQMLAKTYLSCRKYATMLVATKAELVANKIPGTGYEMYEKLVGSAKMYPVTKEIFAKSAADGYCGYGLFDSTQVTINNFEEAKKVSLIDNIYFTYKLTNDYKALGAVRLALKDAQNLSKDNVSNIEAAQINPIKATSKDAQLNDVTNNNESYIFDKQAVLRSFT